MCTFLRKMVWIYYDINIAIFIMILQVDASPCTRNYTTYLSDSELEPESEYGVAEG